MFRGLFTRLRLKLFSRMRQRMFIKRRLLFFRLRIYGEHEGRCAGLVINFSNLQVMVL